MVASFKFGNMIKKCCYMENFMWTCLVMFKKNIILNMSLQYFNPWKNFEEKMTYTASQPLLHKQQAVMTDTDDSTTTPVELELDIELELDNFNNRRYCCYIEDIST